MHIMFACLTMSVPREECAKMAVIYLTRLPVCCLLSMYRSVILPVCPKIIRGQSNCRAAAHV
jgi:hypothetical protein